MAMAAAVAATQRLRWGDGCGCCNGCGSRRGCDGGDGVDSWRLRRLKEARAAEGKSCRVAAV